MTYSKEQIKTAIEVAVCAIAAKYGEDGLFIRRGAKQNVIMEFAEVVDILTDFIPEDEEGGQDDIRDDG